MHIDQRELQGAIILDCCGRFGEEDQAGFMETIEKLQVIGCSHLVLNFTSLYGLDSKALSLLDFAHDFLKANSSRVTLVCPLSSVLYELNQAQVPRKIPTYPTMYDALHRPKVLTH
jgi:anti-anti-sigma regulatory factor